MKRAGWITLGIVAAISLVIASIWSGYTGGAGYGSWGMMGGQHMRGFSGYPMMGFVGGFGMLLF